MILINAWQWRYLLFCGFGFSWRYFWQAKFQLDGRELLAAKWDMRFSHHEHSCHLVPLFSYLYVFVLVLFQISERGHGQDIVYLIPSYIVIRGGEREGKAWFLFGSKCGGWSGWGGVLPAVIMSGFGEHVCMWPEAHLTCSWNLLAILQLWGWSWELKTQKGKDYGQNKNNSLKTTMRSENKQQPQQYN